MPPKGKKSASPSPKPKAKGQAKAKEAEVEDPKVVAEKEAGSVFEKYVPDGNMEGVIKLKEFAVIIRDMNVKKCMLWGDDPVDMIKAEWKNIGGNVKKEVPFADFKEWWPNFVVSANEAAEKKIADEEAKTAADANAKAEKYGHDGVWKINMKDLKEAMKEAKKKEKIPLIIDNTENHVADTFFMYSDAFIVECKKLIMDKAKGASIDEILEELRAKFVQEAHCFKYGKTVCFRMANSACDLKNQWNTEIFPAVALLDQKLLNSVVGEDNVANVKESPFMKMAKDKDDLLDLECGGIHNDFSVVVVTHFEEASYEEFLAPALPLEMMQPIMPSVD